MRKSNVVYFTVFFVVVSLVLLYAGFSVLASIRSFREVLHPIVEPPSPLTGIVLIGAGIGLAILGAVFLFLVRRRRLKGNKLLIVLLALLLLTPLQ